MPDEADDFLTKWAGSQTAQPDEADAFLAKYTPKAEPAPYKGEVYADGTPVETAASFDDYVGTQRTDNESFAKPTPLAAPYEGPKERTLATDQNYERKTDTMPYSQERDAALRDAVDAEAKAFAARRNAEDLARKQTENDASYYNRSIVRPLKGGVAAAASFADRIYETADAAVQWTGGAIQNVLTGKNAEDFSPMQKTEIAGRVNRHAFTDLVGGRGGIERQVAEDPGLKPYVNVGEKAGQTAADLAAMMAPGAAGIHGAAGFALGTMATELTADDPNLARAAASGALAYAGMKGAETAFAPVIARVTQAAMSRMLPEQARLIAKVLTGVAEGSGMSAAPHVTKDGLHSALLGAISGNPDDQVSVATNILLTAAFRAYSKEIPTDVAAAYVSGDMALVPKQLRPLMDSIAGPIFRGGSDVAREGPEMNPARRRRVMDDRARARANEPESASSPLNPDAIGVRPTERTIAVDPTVELNPTGVGVRPADRPIGAPLPKPEVLAPTTEASIPVAPPVEVTPYVSTEAAPRKDDAPEVAPVVPEAARPVESAPVEPPASARPEATPRPSDVPDVIPGRAKSADAIEREARKEKSLSQVVRELGGFDYNRSSGFTGELDMLRQKDSASSGLVKTKAGGGRSPEEMMQAVRELGFEIDPETNGGDFVRRVVEDIESGGRDAVPGSERERLMSEAEVRRGEDAEAQRWAEATPEERDAYRQEADERWARENEDAAGGDDSFDVGEPPAKAKAEPKVERPNPDELESIKNREVNRKRVLRGLGEMEKPLRQGQEEVVGRAIDRMFEREDAGKLLVDELNAKPRPHTAEEAAMLVIHRVDLRRKLKEADLAGKEAADARNEEGVAAAKKRADELNADLLASEFASQSGGTETARGLAMRRIEMKHDYSLEKMTADRMRENDYKDLNEKQTKEVEELHKRIQDAIAERDKAVSRADALEAERKFRDTLGETRSRKAPPTDPKAYGAKNKLVTTADYEATKKALLSDLSALGANRFLDPAVLAKAGKLVVYHVEAGARTLADFVARATEGMTDKEKDAASPYLESAWESERKRAHDDTVVEISAKVKDRVTAGKGIKNEIGRLVESFLEQGVTDPKALAKAVHDVVKESVPEITEREVMDAYSDYGNQRKLDMDPLKVKARDIRAQWQKLAALDDMAHQQKPKGSGFPRQEPSDAARELTKQINEGKKKAIAEGWWKDETGPGQLKSALDAAKKRAQNAITDMDRQIKARVKDIPNRTALKPDAELEALRAEKAAKQKEYDAVFGKNTLTDAQRADMAVKAAEKSIAEWERKITTGDLSSRAKPAQPTDPRVIEARQRAKDLREYVEELRDLARPHRTPEEIAHKSLMTYLKNREKMFLDRVARNDLEPKPRVQRPRNAEAIQAEANVEAAKQKWAEALFKDRLAKRSWVEKAVAVPIEAQATARAIMTSLDLSAVLRQGGIDTFINPARSLRAMGPMFQAFGSKGGMERAMAEIRMHPDFAMAKRAGLQFTETGTHDLSKMEEAFKSRLAEHIPLVNHSQRAYTTFLNRLRLDAFSAALHNLKGAEAPTLAEAKHLAEWVNIKMGRGTGKMANALAGLDGVFFAPKQFISRFQFIGAPLPGGVMWRKGGTARTRMVVAKEAARFYFGAAVLVGLGKMLTGNDDTDPEDPNTLKFQIGETHIDPMAGLGQAITFASRMIHDASYGVGLADKREGLGTLETMSRFVRSKAAPGLGAAINTAEGKTFTGQDTTIGNEALGLITPMAVKDIVQVWQQDYNIPARIGASLAALFGMGVQTYPDRTKKSKGRHH